MSDKKTKTATPVTVEGINTKAEHAEATERVAMKLSKLQHAALAIQVSLTNPKPSDEDVTMQEMLGNKNPLMTTEIATELQRQKLLDEKGNPTAKGVAIILRNLTDGINFEKLVSRLTKGAKFSLLFILTKAMDEENSEGSIHYLTLGGEPNKFWDEVDACAGRILAWTEAAPENEAQQ